MEITNEQPPQPGRGWFWRGVTALVRAFALLAAAALAAMGLLTCADIAMRLAGFAFTGAYDLVRILGLLAVAGALPLTTAVKGHVAIEYFFDKLGPRARLAVDSLMRAVMILALAAATHGFLARAANMRRYNEVSTTLQIPLFWLFWVLAASCALTALAVLFHLAKPGKEMVGP